MSDIERKTWSIIFPNFSAVFSGTKREYLEIIGYGAFARFFRHCMQSSEDILDFFVMSRMEKREKLF